MAATENSGIGHGTSGSPQESIEEQIYPQKVSENQSNASNSPPVYSPSPKHEPNSGWGSANPISSKEEGQKLLDSGIHKGKQVYNVTKSGKIVKFQPSSTPNNEYHAYEVTKPRDVPSSVLKQLLNQGKITKAEYNKFRKGKK